MIRITVVDHYNVELSKLHWEVIHTKGRRVTIKDRSERNGIRNLNPAVLVTYRTEPLTWDNAMELVRGNDCVVDTSNNPRTWYLINDACVLEDREMNVLSMTNGVRGRGGDPILLVSRSGMSTEV